MMKKKPFIYFNLFILLSLLFAVAFTCCAAKNYRVEIPNTDAVPVSELEITTDSDCIELAELKEEPERISCLVTPRHMGTDRLEIVFGHTDSSPASDFISIRFFCGPFHTVFVMDPFLDFSGSGVVIAVLYFDILLTAVFMTVMYIRYLKHAAFSYGMVACGGIALFTVINLLVLMLASAVSGGVFLLNLFQSSFGSVLSGFSSFGSVFSLISTPFMAVFSVAVTVSNLVLIRKEGFRPVNLLGVLLGVAWLIGMAVHHFFDSNASGSSEHGRIFTSITSAISIVISYFICMLFATVLSAWLASRRRPPFDRDYIVILGCAIRQDGSLTPLLRGRVDAALSFAREQREKTGKSVKFVPSGGQGSDEVISESEAMKRYLLEQGVPEEQILTDARSVNTLQNVQFSKQVIEADTDKPYHTAVATTNYHVFRSYILAQKAGLQNMRGVSAKTKWYFFPNAFLRELAGLVVDQKRLHIFMVLLLMSFFALINALSFLG